MHDLQHTKNDNHDRNLETSFVNKEQLTKTNPIQSSRSKSRPLSRQPLDSRSIKPIYVLYPNYTLPNLDFLSNDQKVQQHEVAFVPKSLNCDLKKSTYYQKSYSVENFESIIKNIDSFPHIYDWDSLSFLLPKKCKQVLENINDLSEKKNGSTSINSSTNATNTTNTQHQSSSGYKGSSTTTLLSDDLSLQNSHHGTQNDKFNPLFVYKYEDNVLNLTKVSNNSRVKNQTNFKNAEHPNLSKNTNVNKRISFPSEYPVSRL